MAVSFNGSGNFIIMGNVSPLTIANNAPFSVSLWINFAAISGVQILLAKGFDVAAGISAYQLFLDSSGPDIGFQSVDTGGSVGHGTTASIAWSTGQWHHIYGDYTGAGGSPVSTWRLYLDGSPASSHFDTVGPYNDAEQFTLGALRTSTASIQSNTNGCMADAAVYNGPLTPTEITNLGNGSLRPNTSMSQTLLGYWKLDVFASPQLDSSVNGNSGTVTGTATCGSSPPYAAAFLPPTFTQSPILQVRNRVLAY